jgi:hypothetical protein
MHEILVMWRRPDRTPPGVDNHVHESESESDASGGRAQLCAWLEEGAAYSPILWV